MADNNGYLYEIIAESKQIIGISSDFCIGGMENASGDGDYIEESVSESLLLENKTPPPVRKQNNIIDNDEFEPKNSLTPIKMDYIKASGQTKQALLPLPGSNDEKAFVGTEMLRPFVEPAAEDSKKTQDDVEDPVVLRLALDQNDKTTVHPSIAIDNNVGIAQEFEGYDPILFSKNTADGGNNSCQIKSSNHSDNAAKGGRSEKIDMQQYTVDHENAILTQGKLPSDSVDSLQQKIFSDNSLLVHEKQIPLQKMAESVNKYISDASLDEQLNVSPNREQIKNQKLKLSAADMMVDKYDILQAERAKTSRQTFDQILHIGKIEVVVEQPTHQMQQSSSLKRSEPRSSASRYYLRRLS